jgi:aconitate decarboxylase
LARSNYKGIKSIFDREYGGFLSTFSHGSEPARPEEVARDLGTTWQASRISIKPYPCMVGIHAQIDCIRELQHSERFRTNSIGAITVEMSEPVFKRREWKSTFPINAIGAQMNAPYVAAAHLTDGAVTMKTFGEANLNRPDLWELISKIDVLHQPEFDGLRRENALCTRATIRYSEDEKLLSVTVVNPRDLKTPLTNDKIVEKYVVLVVVVVGQEEREAIENAVLSLDSCTDVQDLFTLLDVEAKFLSSSFRPPPSV